MKKQISGSVKQMCQSVGLLFVSGLLVAGCATSDSNVNYSDLPPDIAGTNAVANTNVGVGGFEAMVERGDRFTVGDSVTVKFSGTIDNPPVHEERIKDDGSITLPLIGVVKAEGKTPGDLQTEIHDRYVPDYYKRMTVTVQGESRVYSVGGQVKSPGRQVYIGATTVTKAIQSAGDFTDFAAKRRVELTRPSGKRYTIDCIKAAKNPSLDLKVYPGDKIEVPMRGWREIFE